MNSSHCESLLRARVFEKTIRAQLAILHGNSKVTFEVFKTHSHKYPETRITAECQHLGQVIKACKIIATEMIENAADIESLGRAIGRALLLMLSEHIAKEEEDKPLQITMEDFRKATDKESVWKLTQACNAKWPAGI